LDIGEIAPERASLVECKISLMPIPDIIRQIDAYLLRLGHARDILAAPKTEAQREQSLLRKKETKAKSMAAAVSSKPRIQDNKSRSKSPPRQGTMVHERVDSVSNVRHSVIRQTTKVSEQRPLADTALAPRQGAEGEAFNSNNRKTWNISAHPKTARKTITSKPDNIKPAIALASSKPSRIVVVSAEQAKWERDRAAKPEVRPHRPSHSNLTGRLAFEALFKDEKDSSKTAGGR
jgi:hypothetical protein